MRQTIAYIISAVLHIVLVVALLPSSASKEEAVIDLPEQLTIDLQALPLPKTELKQEPKPVFAKAIKPLPIKPLPVKKVQKKVTTQTPINQTPKPPITPLEENKIEEPNTEVIPPTSAVLANKQKDVEPITTSKRQIENKSESLIIHNPTYKTQRPVKYPKSAKRKKLQGTVTIRAALDSSGHVQKAWVHESSGHAALDRSAVRSVKAWTFAPAQQGKLTVASTVQFPVVFQLK